MGLEFIGGLSWAEVTREERFFCQRLYELIRPAPHTFVTYANQMLNARLPVDANWEAVFEVCFYRDLWHYRGRVGSPFSPKRTFDLCLLSDLAVIVVEAKADQEFEAEQLKSIGKDRRQISLETGISTIAVLGLVSSSYAVPSATGAYFDGILTWAQMAGLYGGDCILLRADEIHAGKSGTSWGQNNIGGHMTGLELLNAHRRGERMFVGRGGGLYGERLQGDLRSGGWQSQRYETRPAVGGLPNRNWFSLQDFIGLIERHAGS